MAEDRLRRLSLIVVAALGSAGTALLLEASEPLWLLGILGAAMAAGQLVRVPAPNGEELGFGIAVAVAVPLLIDDPYGVGAVYAFGLLASWLLLDVRTGGRERARAFLVSGAAALGAYACALYGVEAAFAYGGVESRWATLIAVAAGALAWFLVDALAGVLVGLEEEWVALRYRWLLALADWPVLLSLFATGALFAFAWPVIRWWAFPLALMPYGFSHAAFVRSAGTRVTYGQTIRALARIPEVAGLAPEGHSVRTAALAVAVGQDLGMRPDDVTELEYAALMHDIGRITLNEPAILKAGYTDEDIARWGAQIVAEAPYLHRVAAYVQQQHHPYRHPGEDFDEELPLAAKIIKVASAYDQAVAEAGLAPLEALEVLHRGAAYDFDPRVVKAMRRVAGRAGAIAT